MVRKKKEPDPVLTPEQVAMCRQVFDVFDKDIDGKIVANDIGYMMRALGLNPTEAEISDMIEQVEKDDLGQMVFPGFIVVMTPQLTAENNLQANVIEEVLEAFRVFDKDGSGMVSADQLYKVLTSLGEKFTDEEVMCLFKEARVDPNTRTLNYLQFMELLYNPPKKKKKGKKKK